MAYLSVNKRAYFYSLDALIALIVILGVVLVIKPTTVVKAPQVNLQEDLIDSLSSLKVGEIDNSYVQNLISNGKITDLDKSVLEQIGEFYAVGDSEASSMANAILLDLAPEQNIGLYFNGVLIASHEEIPIESAKDIWTSRQIISGIQAGEPVTGYSSRAFLSSSNKVDYFYFGGYVGDGNITVQLENQIEDIDIEAVFNDDFNLYINDNFVDSYSPVPDVPFEIDLSSYIGFFTPGTNYIDFKTPIGADKNLFIAGGFIKVVRQEGGILTSSTKTYFPGVDGFINLYDSFYIPGTLNSMEIFLRYNSSQEIFLTVGNKTVFQGASNGNIATDTLTNSELSLELDYDEIVMETVPLRLGLVNSTYIFNESVEADVFSVTDISGSMDECVINCSTFPIKMIDLAKDANNLFIETLLEVLGNRVGLVGYESVARDEDFHSLSEDVVSLEQQVEDWKPGGGTCICCGINRARDALISESSSEKYQSMVVMSDGRANAKCSEQGTGDASQDAIQAACTAYDEHGIVVNAVGFGDNADETTFQAIAACGGGNYYFSDIDQIVDLYEKIAEDIINASFKEQTIVGTGLDAQLFPESYISLDFNKVIPYGLVIKGETVEFGNLISEGEVFVPEDARVFDVSAVSYSGSKWTDKVEVFSSNFSSWEKVFDLAKYNSPYVALGDPFVVNVPVEKIINGTNKIRISTGLSPINSSGGNVHDKIIYTFVKDIASFSPIVTSANGCIWIIEFEGGSNETFNVPLNYGGTAQCYYNTEQISYNDNDAINIAIFRLLEDLDLNSNRMVETKFSEQDLELDSSEIQGIPFTWDTEVQARVWR